jgi:uncharacterized membrane protein
VVALVAAVVTALTLWAYALRMKGSQGAWRWVALGLRLAAVLLCVLAALRPSVVFQEKQKQPAALLFLSDFSTSMTLADEARGQSRWDVARATLAQARDAAKKLGKDLGAKFYRFDSTLHDDPEGDKKAPEGRATAMGTALLDAVSREAGTRVASVIVLSDGANNAGTSPLTAARQLRGQQIPVVTVGFGKETAGSNSRDIAVRSMTAGPTVFVKNQLQVRGLLTVRGFPNQTVDAELLVEGQDEPVATRQIHVPEGTEEIPVTGLKYVPQTPGERKVTLRVKPKAGELVPTNNEYSTFVTVLKGGLNVLFVQGPHSPWEQKFWLRSVESSPDIRADLKVIRKAAVGDEGELPDILFAPGSYDVYVLSDLPADFLTRAQRALLAKAVENGAGLIMLGGRSSFGEGGWAGTEVAGVLPVNIRPGDGQLEPDGGVKVVPNRRGLESYLMQVGPNPAESARLWNALPPLSGINRFQPKDPAIVLAESPGNRPVPVMAGMEAGQGRTLAFGGETWVWARASDEGRLAHRKFWRQVIFWLAHREDKGANEVKLTLDARRIAVGQTLNMGVSARDAKGEPMTDLKLEAKVEGEPAPGKKFSEPVEFLHQGQGWRGQFLATQAPPGDYRVTVVATRNGQEVGRDSARFLVYQDESELERPAADRLLLRQVAEASGGEAVPPEQLAKYIQSLQGKVFTETFSQTERKIWDNWPFLLLFTALLVVEWAIRKKHGWV